MNVGIPTVSFAKRKYNISLCYSYVMSCAGLNRQSHASVLPVTRGSRINDFWQIILAKIRVMIREYKLTYDKWYFMNEWMIVYPYSQRLVWTMTDIHWSG